MNHAKARQVAVNNTTPAHRYILPFTLLSLTGCMTTTPINIDDKHASLPTFRVDINLEDGKKSSAEPQTGHALEFVVLKARGGSQQALVAGELPIILNSSTFASPQLVRNDFDLYVGDASYRWRKFFGERKVGLDLSGGLGYSSLNLSVVSATQRESAYFGNYGIQGGAGVIWRFRPGTSLNARVSGFFSTASTGVSDFGRYEIFLAQALGDSLELRAGYAKWEVNGNSALGTSDFRLTVAGPTLDLGLSF